MKSLAIMTAEEERGLAIKIRHARSDVWTALLSNSTVLEAALETCQELAGQGRSDRQLSIKPKESIALIAAARRYDRRGIEAYEVALRRAREPVVAKIASFDTCLDIGMVLMKKVKEWADRMPPERSDTYKIYLKKIDSTWKIYCIHRNKFIEKNIRLVSMIAKRFASFGIPHEDLVQEGALGLHRAVGMFDPDMGFKFSTYASWWIRASIFRHCRNKSRIVRIPINTQEKLERYHGAIRHFNQTGVDADIKKISKASGVSEKSISYIRSVALDNCQSTELDLGGILLGDTIAEETDHIESVNVGIDAGLVQELMDTLPQRQRFILNARFGLEGKDGMTLQEIADIFGMSRERIRQIEAIAISQLRTLLEIAGQQ